MLAALAGIAHGTNSPDGQAAVAALMATVALERPDLAVRLGFVDVQHPNTAETLDSLAPGQSVIVVPLLLSAGYHVHVDLARSIRAETSRPAILAGALGPDERLSTLLVRRLGQAGFTADDVLVLAAAGSSDARAVADCRTVAAQLAAASGHSVTLGFLSAAEPRLEDAVASVREANPGRRVVVSSYLLAPGYFQDLAVAAGGDVTTSPLLRPDEDPPRELVEVVLDRFAATLPEMRGFQEG